LRSNAELIDQAIAAVPRAPFCDGPVPASDAVGASIGHRQRGTPPDTVRRMLLEAEVTPGQRVLELGAGSGYATAVLAALGADVDAVERNPALVLRARACLATLGLSARVHHGDARLGWPGGGPYDIVLATVAVRTVPGPWLRQLGADGVLVVPIGPPDQRQELTVFRRDAGRLTRHGRGPARFAGLVS